MPFPNRSPTARRSSMAWRCSPTPRAAGCWPARRHELTVAELCDALALPQSTVRRHLKTLADDGWVAARARRHEPLLRPHRRPAARVVAAPVGARARRRRRHARGAATTGAGCSPCSTAGGVGRQFFSTAAGQWDGCAPSCSAPPPTCASLPALLPPDCGRRRPRLRLGAASPAALAPFVGTVVAVDESAAMLAAARERIDGTGNVDHRRGQPRGAARSTTARSTSRSSSLVLHYVAEPALALAEAARALRPGGRLVVVDMLPHEREEYRRTMGHIWLGFDRAAVEDALSRRRARARPLARLALEAQREGPRPVRRHRHPPPVPTRRTNHLMATDVKTTHPFEHVRQGRPRARSRSPTSRSPSSAARRSASPSRRCPASWRSASEYARQKPLAGARIMGSLHMTVQTAVLIETLVDLGADVRWVSLQHLLDAGPRRGRGRRRPPGDRRHRRRTRAASRCSPGRARRSRSTGGAPSRRCMWPDGGGPNCCLDDGGDATLLVHKGAEFEKAGTIPAFDAGERPRGVGRHPRPAPRASCTRDPERWTKVAADIKGVSEETTTGVHRLYEMMKAGTLLFPAINVNDSVTKSKFDNIYGCRHSVIDGLNRATDVMLARQARRRLRLRRSRQGLRAGAARPGRARRHHRDRSDLRAAGGDGGLSGRDARGRRRDAPTSSSRRPATTTSSPPTTWRG